MGKGKHNRGKKRNQGRLTKAQQKTLSDLHNSSHTFKQANHLMFQRCSKPQDVKVLFETAEYISDTSKLIQLDKLRDGIVKLKQNKCPYDESINIIDLKISLRGPQEDEAFGLDPLLYKNLRRGNTLLQFQDKRSNDKLIRIARKGLNKFFDISLERALKATLEGHSIEIVKTLKANGENAQVSYLKELDSWVVASKNTGLLAQNREQIQLYDSSTYQFPKEMAECWFDYLDRLEQIKGKQSITDLKNFLDGRTFVGEYVGSIEHQHMVKYDRVSLIFYAIVDNYSQNICMPQDQAIKTFNKFEIDHVKMESLGVYKNFNQFLDRICQAFKDIAQSSINDDEEGSVLYFIKRDKENNSDRDVVLSLVKLKTLEYRAFRKMREKLRGFFRTQDTADKDHKSMITRFEKEMKEVSQGNDLPFLYQILYKNQFLSQQILTNTYLKKHSNI